MMATAKIAANSNRGSKPGERRGGRRKGTPNKTTGALKDMILEALNQSGGVGYLIQQADEEPKAFMALLGRVLPMQLQGGGSDGEHVHRIILEGVMPK